MSCQLQTAPLHWASLKVIDSPLALTTLNWPTQAMDECTPYKKPASEVHLNTATNYKVRAFWRRPPDPAVWPVAHTKGGHMLVAIRVPLPANIAS